MQVKKDLDWIDSAWMIELPTEHKRQIAEVNHSIVGIQQSHQAKSSGNIIYMCNAKPSICAILFKM